MSKKLKTTAVIVWSLTLFFSTLIILNRHLFPALGFFIVVHHTGTSMEPTINTTTLSINDLDFPFEDLKVGDIITFRKRKMFYSTSTIHMTANKGEEPKEVEKTEEEPKNERTGEIQYTKERIEHRIIGEAIENGEKAFITQGDNNDGPDQYPVVKSGFIGKNVFFVNGLAQLFKITYAGLLLVSAVVGVLVIKNLIAKGKVQNDS